MAFTIGRKGQSLEQVTFDHFDIGLLARGDGSEVMIQTIAKDNLFYIYPSENPSVMEFVYILKGEMVCELNGEKIQLGPHDYFTSINLEEPIHFAALTDVVYLWIITEPTFFQLSKSITSLKKIVDEVEKKDRYTYKHSERVSTYAVKIAKKLMLPKDRLENLYISSILHDIGKIKTPEEILNKPGKLTKEEFEKLENAGEESSNEWNNAGTGHSALCELNYTVEKADGSIDISKAIRINEQFQVSRQFWSYLVNSGLISNPQDFIRQLPHMSLVLGEKNVDFLKKRFEALTNNPLFQGMEFSEDPKKLKKWIPLIMEGRTSKEPIAATKIDSGTDVNFGALTRMMFDHLRKLDVEIKYNHQVEDIKRSEDGLWDLKVWNMATGNIERHSAKFVFIGGGGGSLHLLQKTNIPESKHIGGFPVSGLFLVCNNPEVVNQHHAKVYGKAAVGAPPMSVPHLDTRFIENKKSLLFGPFAGFSPKFLKTGSNMDLITSVKPNNLVTMLAAGAKNIPLTKYLIGQLMLSKEKRIEELREFIPNAKSEDWDIVVAGQRVQVIKDTEAGGKGTLEFGTEVVSAADGSIAALLGASPGASTAVHVMLQVIKKCFPQHLNEWEMKIKEMIPSYGISLAENPKLFTKIHTSTAETLGLSEDTSGQKGRSVS